MRLTRVHVDTPLHAGARLTLPEHTTGHLVRVLRLRENEPCVLFNGDGHDYDAVLLTTSKRGAEIEITGMRRVDNESPLRITLLQGIARGEKMDLILQKATELGVAAIVPVFADRTEVRLDGERLDKRMAHWHSVIVSACEQSGRARVPELPPARALAEAATTLPLASIRLTLDPQGEHRFDTLTLALSTDAQVVVGIGPEGGWSNKDRDLLHTHSFGGLRLGPRVLRTETAGLATIAALQARFGDL